MSSPKFRSGHVAILGRPNVGKSTLVNCLLGEERMLVFDQPGNPIANVVRLAQTPRNNSIQLLGSVFRLTGC